MVFSQKEVLLSKPNKLKYAFRKNTTDEPAREKTIIMTTICQLFSIPHLVFSFSNTINRNPGLI